MPHQPETAHVAADPIPLQDATSLVVATFADLYRQEVAAEEDVHRTLPFFGTALGIVIGALAYAAGRLPKFTDVATHRGLWAFAVSSGLLGLAVIEAALVLVWLSRAIARRDYQRIGPEPALHARLVGLQAYYEQQGVAGEAPNGELARDMHLALIEFVYGGDTGEPGFEPETQPIPGFGVVPPREKLDLGAWRDHCNIHG